MSDKYLLIIGGGVLSTYAIRAAQRAGYRVLCTDRDPDCPGSSIADAFMQADVYSVTEQITAALQAEQMGLNIMGVYIAGIDAAHVGATVARALSLPGVNPRAAWLCRRKDLFRQACDGKVKQPEYWIRDDTRWTDVIEPPYIIKAVDNSGGRGLTVVRDDTDMTGITFGQLAHHARLANIRKAERFLIEPLLTGREFSTEIVNIAGDWFYLNTVERFFAGDYAVEVGHVNPAPLSCEQETALFKTAIQTAEAVGADWGVFKCDTIWPHNATPDDPDSGYGGYVIEATCRWSGGFDSQVTTPLASGRDFLAWGARMAAGEAVTSGDPEILRKHNRAAAVWCPLPEPMTLARIDTQEAAEVPGVVQIEIMPFAKSGAHIRIDSSAARPVFVIAEGDTVQDALAAAKDGAERVQFYG